MTRTAGFRTTGWTPLEAVALVVGISALAMAHLIRRRFTSRGPASAEQWRTPEVGWAALLWSLLELPAVIGAITLMATRHLPVFAGLAILSVGGLVLYRPSRLAE